MAALCVNPNLHAVAILRRTSETQGPLALLANLARAGGCNEHQDIQRDVLGAASSPPARAEGHAASGTTNEEPLKIKTK